MKALTKILAGGIAAAFVFGAAPAAAQYYPYGGYGYGNSGISVTIGTPGYGYGNGYGYSNGYGAYGRGYGVNQQVVVNQCTSAVQAQLGGNMGYGYSTYGVAGGRVLGISRIEPRIDGGLTVRGVAASSGYNQQPDLTFKCRTDYRGFVTSVEVQRAQSAYGYTPYGAQPYGYASPYQPSPYNTGPYGYSRY